MTESIPLRESTRLTPSAPGSHATHGPDELHELRVRISDDLHRQLLSLKVLRGKSLAETVSLALDIYFAERKRGFPESGASRRGPPLTP